MDFVTVSTGLILPYWMGLPIRYIHSISGIVAAKNAGVYKVVAINKNKMLPCKKADYIISDYKNAIKIIE